MAQSYAFFGRLESSIFYIFGSPIVGALPKQQESKLSVKVNIITNFKNIVDENNYTNINHVHIGQRSFAKK